LATWLIHRSCQRPRCGGGTHQASRPNSAHTRRGQQPACLPGTAGIPAGPRCRRSQERCSTGLV